MLPRVVFHHVHKCAGTTLLKFLAGTAPPERSAFVESLVAAPDPDGVEAVAALLRAEFLHDPFGVHDWKALLGHAVDVIFLRDPVERLWSEWRMITRWDDALVASRGDGYRHLRDVAREGFGPFLALPGAAPFGNALACHLAFGDPLLDAVRAAAASGGAPPEALLATLDARLSAIDVVGFVETFEDSLLDLVDRLGWPPPDVLQAHNVHAAAVPLTPGERALAEVCTTLDRPLVDAARRRAAARRSGDAAARRRAALELSQGRVVGPPPGLLVDMGEGFVGSGWHPCEINGRRRTRWTGPQAEATLLARVARDRPLEGRLRVGNHLDPAQVEGLVIRVDGVPVPADHWVLPPFDHVWEFPVPAAPVSGDLVRLSIDCGRTLRPPNPADGRMLGVEIGEIELAPAGRLVPRSLGGLARVRGELAALAATPDGDRRMACLLAGLPPG